jgi:hypothetical protein
MRHVLIAEAGLFDLVVTDSVHSKIGVVKVLRRAPALTMEEAARLLHHIPGAVATGIEVEMLWLQELLERFPLGVRQTEGHEASSVRGSSPPSLSRP